MIPVKSTVENSWRPSKAAMLTPCPRWKQPTGGEHGLDGDGEQPSELDIAIAQRSRRPRHRGCQEESEHVQRGRAQGAHWTGRETERQGSRPSSVPQRWLGLTSPTIRFVPIDRTWASRLLKLACRAAQGSSQKLESEGRLASTAARGPRRGRPLRSENRSCVEHRRSVPVALVDVAGLVPGASEGRGRGNAFCGFGQLQRAHPSRRCCRIDRHEGQFNGASSDTETAVASV